MVYFCMPLFLMCFLSSFCRGLFFSLGSFPFWIPLSRCLLLSYYEFFFLGASAPLGPLLSMFFSLPLFFLQFPMVPHFLSWLHFFYSKLIQWDFSLLPIGLHQLFLVCCGHPFKITHSPIGCPTTVIVQFMFAAPLPFS